MSNEVGASHKQDPFAQKQASVSTSAEERMGETWPITIPEQIVGSSHQFEFPAPKNRSSLGAIGILSVDGSAEVKADWGRPIALPGMGSGPLKLTYAPTTAGEKHATVTLVMRWEDGHVETRAIQVNTRARKLDDMPASQPNSAPVQPNTTNAPKAPDRVLTADANVAWLNADTAFYGMIEEQKQGVDDVADEAKQFKPKPAERSLWEDLADIAFQLGTGAIAGLVARYVASRVSSALVRAEHAATAAQKGEAEIASAEKSANAAKGDVVEEREANQHVVAVKVGNYATADAAKHAKFAQGEAASATGMAVSTSITKAANEIRGGNSGAGTPLSQPAAPKARAASADGKIAFFSEQSSMIHSLRTSGTARLNAELAELIKTHPETASDLMAGVQAGFSDAAAEAKERQAATTSAQFMTYLARTNLGTEKVTAPDGSHVVTDMAEQRGEGTSRFQVASLATGVLEIACDYQRGGAVHVIDARAVNVSWLVVNRLLDKRLASSGIPLRLSLHGGGTIITRDEAGRVRVSGALDLTAPFREEQQIHEAERIFDLVLSKSLADWGVAQIHTNDATQGPDPESKKP